MSLPKFDYLRAKTQEEVCSFLSTYEEASVIAGGTDILVQMKSRKAGPRYLIGLKSITNWDYIERDTKGVRIGALATLHDIQHSSLIQKEIPLLAHVARQMATPHIRRMGTLGGNLCNASPAADMAPPLLCLGASVRLKSFAGERTALLEEFFTGPGTTLRKKGEIVTEVEVPFPPARSAGIYLKLPARTAVDIAAVGVAVVMALDPKDDTCSDIKIALGAVAPVPVRAVKGEELLKGRKLDADLIQEAAKASVEQAQPIGDVRASAEYRTDMVRILVQRALQEAQAHIKSA